MIDDMFKHSLFPMGFISMGSLLEKEGYNVRIVNLELEKALYPLFDVESYLRHAFEFEIAAIDLHWWVHSYDSLELARLCKKINPNCLTVLGGLTATFFARELMKKFPFIDVIIKGEGEIPMAVLAEKFLKGKSIKDVPNSIVREKGKLYENKISYVADSLNDLNFTDLSLLNHWEEHFWLYAGPLSYAPIRGDTVFSPWLCIARGCIYNCSFCGGTREAQRLCAGRSQVTLRAPDKVVEDILFLESLGIRKICFSHSPAITGEKHFKKILSLLQKEKVDIWGFMELWQIPTLAFIRELEKSFNNLQFRVCLGSGSEEVRRFNRVISVSNKDILKFLEECIKTGVKIEVTFSSKYPLENRETFRDTLKLMEKMILEKGITNIQCGNLSLEPASPIYLYPKKYGVISKIRSFIDYYDLLKKKQRLPPSGYHTQTLSDRDAIELLRKLYQKKKELISKLNRKPSNYSFY